MKDMLDARMLETCLKFTERDLLIISGFAASLASSSTLSTFFIHVEYIHLYKGIDSFTGPFDRMLFFFSVRLHVHLAGAWIPYVDMRMLNIFL